MDLKLKSLTLDSREVAKMLNKNHADLLRDITRNIEYLTESNFALSEFFQENQYKDSTGKRNKRYDITKKGCEFLAHKLTGKKGAIFTATYINKFHEMEQELKESKQKQLPFKLTWKGKPVMEVQQFAKMIGMRVDNVHWACKNTKITLKRMDLYEYEKENSKVKHCSSISILFKEAIIELCKYYGIYEKYKELIENYFKYDNRLEDKTSKVPTEKPFNDKYYNEIYDCMKKAYDLESKIEKIYKEELLPLYNRIEKLNEIKRDCMISLFNGMKYGDILGQK